MPADRTIHTKIFGWTTLTLGALCLVIVGYAFTGYDASKNTLEGRLLPDVIQGQISWQVLTPQMLMSGSVLIANRNVVIQLPDEDHLVPNPILRKVLFGTNDPDIRYWGYCLPEEYDRGKALKSDQLPGQIFLSEGERKARKDSYNTKLHESFSVDENLTNEDLNQLRTPPKGTIRHQFETFEPGSVCYVMSEHELAVGMDRDEDGANEEVERRNHTNPVDTDTDGDGSPDGCEIIRLGTDPLKRDSDGDALIDSKEDENSNCHYDAGKETNPLEWDTDNDGLPDGLMRLGPGRKSRLMGEDKNLNGIIDEGETDPRQWSTAMDDISDGDRYWKCIFNQEKEDPLDC